MTQYRSEPGIFPVKPRRTSCAAFSRISCELASLYHAVRGVHIKLTASFNGPINQTKTYKHERNSECIDTIVCQGGVVKVLVKKKRALL